ncbi:MAG: SPOR domain-containing protein [Quisquiliibacterium sp.]
MASRTSSTKSSAALDPALSQKKRARRRLIGAAAVCLAAAILLPVLLDSEPRQVRGDVEARIPSRDTPLYEPADPTARSGSIRQSAPQPDSQSAASGGTALAPSSQSRVDGAASTPAQTSQPAAPQEAQQAPKQAAEQAAQKSSPQTTPNPAASTRDAAADSKRADDPIAKLARAQEAQTPPADPKAGGFIVQVGAFASDKSAAEQIDRTSKAGFKAYRETIKTAQGERIRVRIGPYATRDEADKARDKLRAAGIESVLIAP